MKQFSALLLLLIAFSFTSCKKSNSSDSNGEYYYDATIDGTRYSVNIPANNSNFELEAGSSLGGFNTVVFSANITDYGTNGSTLSISKGMMPDYQDATISDFKNFFTPGAYNYSDLGENGMTIQWQDPSGNFWTTEGTDQTGSTIRIVSIEDRPDDLGTYYMKTKVEFTCRLTDGAGNIKIASGTLVGLFGMI
jgi:hypothetical protein